MRGLVVGVVTALVIGACAGATASPGAGRTIQIEMNDYSFSPEIISLRAGEKVTLSFKNVGKLEHEFMAGSEPVIGKGYAMDWLAGAQLSGTADHGMAHGGEGVRVAPNGTAVATIVVPEPGGAFEFGCFVIAHYESGMRGRLIVEAAAAPIPGETAGASRAPIQTSMPSHAPMGGDDGEGH
jgi:uncharacterized cupredoxin-like copper-binding protein